VRTTVILPAYRAGRTLPLVLAALEPQVRDREEREAVIVESGGDGQLVRRLAPWARVVSLPERVLPGEARNLGARHAHGELLAFLDADTIPSAKWLDTLEHALADGAVAAAGAIVNGTPRSAVGTTGFLLEFAEYLPSRRGRLLHAGGGNLILHRDTLGSEGGFVESIWPGEDTILTHRLACAGRLRFAPDAQVRHLNRTGFRDFLRHQRRLGVAFAEMCTRIDYPHGWVVRGRLAPLAFMLRLAALGKRLGHHPREAAQALAMLPLVVVGLVAWSAGVVETRW
jgi:glycosyltransferase involved in cell wall biosynthesis